MLRAVLKVVLGIALAATLTCVASAEMVYNRGNSAEPESLEDVPPPELDPVLAPAWGQELAQAWDPELGLASDRARAQPANRSP